MAGITSYQIEEAIKETARRRLWAFVKYMKRNYVLSEFHKSYIRIIEKFAKGEIKNLIIQAPPQHGKALRIDTPVLTTQGWKKHGDLQIGDYVFGEDGKPKKVLWNSGSYNWHTMFVDFADGFSLQAAHEHEWNLWVDRDDHKGRRLQTIETQNIFKKRNRRNPYIKADAVLQMPEKELPIEPYLLGYWLGDGYSASGYICSGKEDAANLFRFGDKVKEERAGYYRVVVNGLQKKLRECGLLKNKHIPEEYFTASESQRRALLAGLMDTDGCVNIGRGMCEFCQKAGRLADDVYILLRTLGYKPTRHEYTAYLYGKDCGKKVRICFVPNKGDKIFGLQRKQERIDNKITKDREDKRKFFIASVSEADNCLVNCISVEDEIYLAGYELVPTHNSELSSRCLPAFMLGKNPDLKIGICSYAATIAKDFNRDVQRIIDTPEYQALFPETKLNGSNVVTISSNYLRNSDVFECVGRQGGLRVVGRGGSLTSKTVDIMILDDLYKDASEANSPIVRAGAWDWYTKVARTRLHNNSQQLIVFTRWHPEDIIGKIIESERVVKIERWEDLENVGKDWALVNFPAIKVGEPTEIDGRQDGEPLWGERHSLERLMKQKMLDPVGFQCLFQGEPGSAEGRLYHPFKTWINKDDYGTFVRRGCYIDVADEGSDYLAAICYDIYKSGNDTWNEKKQRFEPILFALVTDIVFTDESTEITSVTVPRMINEQGTQKVWIESNNGGSQYAKNITKKVRALCIPFYQGANKESRIVTSAPFVNTQIVFPFGWETRYPKAYDHLTNFLRQFSANTHDDMCFVAGTMIATPFGNKPIEEIKVGDFVITPLGYRKVIAAGCTGIKKVTEKYGLCATPNHPIFIGNKFERIDSICGTYENLVYLYNIKSLLLWKYKKLLFSTEWNTALWGRESIIFLNQKQMLAESIRKDCILRFGNFITERKYRKGFAFIIKTAILLIMTSLIWNAYQFGNICKNTRKRIFKIPNMLRKIVRLCRKDKRKQKNGIGQRMAGLGIANIHYLLIKLREISKFVFNVVKNFYLIKKKQDFVVILAEKNTEQEYSNITASAKIAGKNLSMENRSPVQEIKSSVAYLAEHPLSIGQGYSRKEKVYNLTIEEAGCYYANGILVSNCDALTGIYEKELADGNCQPYGNNHRGIIVH